MYANWESGEPNNGGSPPTSNEDVTYIRDSGLWNDYGGAARAAATSPLATGIEVGFTAATVVGHYGGVPLGNA